MMVVTVRWRRCMVFMMEWLVLVATIMVVIVVVITTTCVEKQTTIMTRNTIGVTIIFTTIVVPLLWTPLAQSYYSHQTVQGQQPPPSSIDITTMLSINLNNRHRFSTRISQQLRLQSPVELKRVITLACGVFLCCGFIVGFVASILQVWRIDNILLCTCGSLPRQKQRIFNT